jgi:NitT/TauT family transport system ATP-binding protein
MLGALIRMHHIPDSAMAASKASIFELQDLGLSFGTKGKGTIEALRNINLTVREGEFLSIVGPSGCGKTTLLRLMSGLIHPTVGEIRFRGTKIAEPPQGIGMAFQDPLLLEWRSVIDNILLPIEIIRAPKRSYVEKARDLLKTVGIDGFEKESPWQLSGGMRQRVNLCRALINDPEVLLLDEPFGALDAFTREELWMVLQTLHQKTDCTVVLITHQLNEAVFLSDRVVVLTSRPGQAVHKEHIQLPKPRDLAIIYTREFIDTVHSLRQRIQR